MLTDGGGRAPAPAPSSPRTASAVILWREGPRGREIYWVKRGALRFAGGFHAFPGGRLDGEDRFLPILQHVVLSNKHIHDPVTAPVSLLEFTPLEPGGTAVSRWLDARRGLELDEFVEEIPVEETRGYVKRVLRSFAAYRLLYGDLPGPGGPVAKSPGQGLRRVR